MLSSQLDADYKHPHLLTYSLEAHLFSSAECPDDDVSGDVCGVEPDVNVVIARMCAVPVSFTLRLYSTNTTLPATRSLSHTNYIRHYLHIHVR